ncbi:hypothetical protein AUEXF2481DRAFT_83023 [Aureobasidium subglaciale EXF-2481]|uniref:DEAD/DEAH-box helicase domain-containing protein n=1 Tax=Aureobasidium subglaciale (strain EXF-2481) TaxID=1043005 RepID=A0A074Y1A5_AURSE|nr:uncharacterized protein AUEXF2481DRAFT_83023 [Aureobasidium subglaciale EXF-2481]KEQ91573.1 hypothetical protein AUEXF2481DRAFT_83023 [Aureobasidium subglaciale EXF-2481]
MASNCIVPIGSCHQHFGSSSSVFKIVSTMFTRALQFEDQRQQPVRRIGDPQQQQSYHAAPHDDENHDYFDEDHTFFHENRGGRYRHDHYRQTSPICNLITTDDSHDLMACAQTAPGKTSGFLFPIPAQAFVNGRSTALVQTGMAHQREVYPTSLILAPTRELLGQIYEESRKLSYRS